MSTRYVGVSVARFDAFLKVAGQAQYASDFRVPGMLHVRLVRSPYPHARIRAVRTADALTVPGVVAVVSGEDITDLPDPFYGPAFKDQRLLPLDEVRYEGEAVAAVVAESEPAAEEGARQVTVEYE